MSYFKVKTLLTESKINAGAVNLKGRNPLHELCRYGKENAAAIFELFLESMPNYTINTPDLEVCVCLSYANLTKLISMLYV